MHYQATAPLHAQTFIHQAHTTPSQNGTFVVVCEKLRQGGLGTDHVTVFYHTSQHDTGCPQRSVSTVVTLPEATSDTLMLIRAATAGARRIWKGGYRYSEAGVITVDLVPLAASQRALIGGLDRERGEALMAALNACNRRWGRDAVVQGTAGFAPQPEWSTRFDMRSPRYTTRLSDIPVVDAA